MKKLVLAAVLFAVPFAVQATTEEACKTAHKLALENGHHEIAKAMEEELKKGNFEACTKLATAAV